MRVARTGDNPRLHAGIQSQQHVLEHNGRKGPVGEFFPGPAFTCFTDGLTLEDLDPEAREPIARWDVRLVSLTSANPVDDQFLDVEERYLSTMRERGQVAVLVRPDFDVFGAARNSRAVSDLLRNPDGQLAAVPPHDPVA